MSGFEHRALFYVDEPEYLASLVSFLRPGIDAGEPALAVLPGSRLAALRDALGADAGAVEFKDMGEVGQNPACIIPAWQDFLDAHPGRRVRGIGEPVFRERSRLALAECQVHERLLNVAFDGGPAWTLVCPYDVNAFPDDVLEEARRSHPLAARGTEVEAVARHLEAGSPLDRPLPGLGPADFELRFGVGELGSVRRAVARAGGRAGLADPRVQDLVLAANEVATNAVRHGGGAGLLRTWTQPAQVTVEVSSPAPIADPLAGRRRPRDDGSARGLWLVNRLCELVELRSGPDGTIVRLHVRG